MNCFILHVVVLVLKTWCVRTRHTCHFVGVAIKWHLNILSQPLIYVTPVLSRMSPQARICNGILIKFVSWHRQLFILLSSHCQMVCRGQHETQLTTVVTGSWRCHAGHFGQFWLCYSYFYQVRHIYNTLKPTSLYFCQLSEDYTCMYMYECSFGK